MHSEGQKNAMDFLNVSASLTGRKWVGPSVEVDRAAEALVAEVRRGI